MVDLLISNQALDIQQLLFDPIFGELHREANFSCYPGVINQSVRSTLSLLESDKFWEIGENLTAVFEFLSIIWNHISYLKHPDIAI